MRQQIIKGSELEKSDIESFDELVQTAFDTRSVSLQENFSPNNIHFYLYDVDRLVAVGRYVKVVGIKVDGVSIGIVFGRSLIGVAASEQGKGYGKKIILTMNDYAAGYSLADIGIHGKKTGLSDFYRKCGLSVDEEIGVKMWRIKNGTLGNLSHAAISYSTRSENIIAMMRAAKRIDLQFSW